MKTNSRARIFSPADDQGGALYAHQRVDKVAIAHMFTATALEL
jgi:hypothetical protein